MSIRSLTHRVKNEVRCYGLWRKTSTAKTKETVSTSILSYLDETSKKEALEESRKQGYAAVQNGVSAPQELGINYLSKEEKGRVRVYGFLRDDVSRLGGMPSHLLDNDQRVIACHRAWMSRLEEHPGVKKFAHKYVLSLDPRFCELMGAPGKDADALLVQGVRTVMRRFQEKFYPGDRLGYMVGIHHDRKHLHAHVLLFPFTENGQHLRVTDKGEDKRFHDLRKVADKFVRDFFFREFEAPVKASERPIDKVMQSRKVSMIAWQSIPKTIPEDDRCAWAANEKRRLQGLPEKELRPILAKRHEDLIRLYREKAGDLGGRKDEVQKLIQNVGHQQVGLKLQLQETEGQIKAAKERQLVLGNAFQAAQKEMGAFRYYTARGGMYGRGVYEAETIDQRLWLNNLLSNPATAESGRAALGGGNPYPILSDINRSTAVNSRVPS